MVKLDIARSGEYNDPTYLPHDTSIPSTTAPAISADGSSIAYVNKSGALILYKISGNSYTTLDSGSGCSAPSFSWYGNRIAYVKNGTVLVANNNGTNYATLGSIASGMVPAINADKSSTGTDGYFVTYQSSSDNNVYVYDLRNASSPVVSQYTTGVSSGTQINPQFTDDFGGTANSGTVVYDAWTGSTSTTVNSGTVYYASNTAPTVSVPAVSTDINAAKTVTIALSDVETPWNQLAVTLTNPSNATMTYSNSGSSPTLTVTGTTLGTASASIKVSDGLLSTTQTFNVTVDSAPTAAANLSCQTDAGAPVTVAAPGLLSGASGGNGGPYSVASYSTTSAHGGTVSVTDSTGAYTYTPPSGFTGTDTFTFKITDGVATSAAATVTITVYADPAAANQSYTTDVALPLTVAAGGLLSGDSGGNGTTLTATPFSGATAFGGTVNINANGSFTYTTPSSTFVGKDTFTYTLTDGIGTSAPATATITINPLPTAQDLFYHMYAGNTQAISLLTGDTGTGTLSATNIGTPDDGTLTNINLTAGTCTYTPDMGYTGPDSFTYCVTDGIGVSAQATVTISVTATPVAVDQSYTVVDGNTLTVPAPGILTNDQGADLTVAGNTTTADGKLSVGTDGSFTYTPQANFCGPDSFTYTVTDGYTTSNSATVYITVYSVPVAVNDTYNDIGGGKLSIPAKGVLANDTNADNGTLTATLCTGPGCGPNDGQVTLNADGSFVYTPNANFWGTDSFTYTASDAHATSQPATVTINVYSVPVAVNDTYNDIGGGKLSIPAKGVLANDTNADNGTLTATLCTGPGCGPNDGQVTLNADGSFTYTPNATFWGTDSFTYTASDANATSQPATVTINVYSVPVVVNQSYTDPNGGPLTVAAPGVLANATNADNGALTAALGTGPANGTVKLNSDGSFTYTPNANTWGTDSFTYTASDANATSQPATVTINVYSVPVANNDNYSVNANSVLQVSAPGVLSNDTNADKNALSAVLGTGPTDGTLKLNSDGSFTYTPNTGFWGSDSFTYTVSDANTTSQPATVTISVNPTIIAQNDNYSVAAENVLSVNAAQGVLANDSLIGPGSLTAVIHTSPANGSLQLNSDGSFTYTPNVGFSGTDSFTYRATNGTVVSNLATTTITVTPAEFSVSNQSYTVVQENILTVSAAQGLLSNDSNPEGQALTAVIHTSPAHGSVTINADGSFNYTPVSGFNGTDSFTFRATNGTVVSNSGTVTITVTPAQFSVSNQSYTVVQENTLTVSAAQGLLSNDSNPDGFTLSAVIHTSPAHGSVTINADGSFSYTPNTGFNGTDSFTFRATNGTVVSNSGMVTITVTPAQFSVSNQSYTVVQENTLTVSAAQGLLSNDSNPEGQALTAVIHTSPAYGSVTINTDGSFSYTPMSGFNGTDSFTFRATNGTVVSNSGTVSISVTPAEFAVNNNVYTVVEDNTLTVTAANGMLADDSNPAGLTLTAQLHTSPANGSLKLNSDGSFTYTPNVGFSGTDSFTYRAVNGSVVSNTGTATITVTPAQFSVSNQSYTVVQENTLTVSAAQGLLSNDSNPEGQALTAVIHTSPAHGSVTINADGSFSYTPVSGFNGTDSFTFRASNGTVVSNSATVTITVTPAEFSVSNQSYTDVQENTLTVSAAQGLLSNDSNPEGQALTAVIHTSPAHGSVKINTDGSFSYTPNTGFNGTDSFTFRATNGTVVSNSATVTITVTPALFIAIADTYTCNEGQKLTVAAAQGVLSNDSNPNGYTLTAALHSSTTNGSMKLNADGSFTYTPNVGFSGTDSFTYRATNGSVVSNIATVTINVTP